MSALIKEWQELSVGGGTMRAYTARPADVTRAPAVLVFQEIYGVNIHIREVTERLAGEGYVAIAPDYFWRTDPNMDLDYSAESRTRGIAALQGLHSETLLDDIEACLTFLQAQPYTTDKVGSIGFCIGGHIAYLAACEADLAASAALYGGGIATMRPGGGAPTVSLTPNIRGELLAVYGAKDASIDAAHVDTVRRALMGARVPYEVAVYPDAGHGFFCDYRATFHEASRDDAWQKVQRLFARTLRG